MCLPNSHYCKGLSVSSLEGLKSELMYALSGEKERGKTCMTHSNRASLVAGWLGRRWCRRICRFLPRSNLSVGGVLGFYREVAFQRQRSVVGSFGPARWYDSYFARDAELDERHDKGDPPLCAVGAPEAAPASKLDGAGTAAAGDNVLEVPQHTPVILHKVLQVHLVIDLANPFHGPSNMIIGAVLVPLADARGLPVLLTVRVVTAGFGK